jgi:hypothetical protein
MRGTNELLELDVLNLVWGHHLRILYETFRNERVAVGVTLQTCNLVVHGKNLGRDASYLEFFLGFPQSRRIHVS